MQFIDTLLLVCLGIAISFLLDAIFEISPKVSAWISKELSD